MDIKITSPGRVEMTALNDLLEEHRVPASARATVLEAVSLAQDKGVAVRSDVSGNGADILIQPAGASVAAYVRAGRLSLRTDRRRAARTAEEYEFCQIEENPRATDPSVHIVIEGWAIEQHAIVVRQLILTSLLATAEQAAKEATAQTAAGAAKGTRARAASSAAAHAPRPTGTASARTAGAAPAKRTRAVKAAPVPVAPPPKPAVCPVHFVVLVNGTCDYCDT